MPGAWAWREEGRTAAAAERMEQDWRRGAVTAVHDRTSPPVFTTYHRKSMIARAERARDSTRFPFSLLARLCRALAVAFRLRSSSERTTLSVYARSSPFPVPLARSRVTSSFPSKSMTPGRKLLGRAEAASHASERSETPETTDDPRLHRLRERSIPRIPELISTVLIGAIRSLLSDLRL